jgi:bla regulator protein blaR1
MTFAWMAYVVLVSTALTIAAYAAERTFIARRRPTRWIWAAAIAASILVPMLISSVTVEIPSLKTLQPAATSVPLRSMTSPLLSPTMWMSDLSEDATPAMPRTDSFLVNAWLYTSAALIAWLFASCLHLAWRRRRWRATDLNGERVYIAQGLGPAVVGFLKPSIVLPPWLLDSPRATQTLVLAHEQQHIAARDPQLLAAAILVLVVMPWNLPVWWQLRRLRHAVEVDCDGRVLAQRPDAVEYGECLLDVGTRLSNSAAAVAAMSESRSLLEKRIRIMMTLPQSWLRASMLAPLALSVAFVAVAAQVSPPNAGDAAAQPATASAAKKDPPKLAKVDPALFERYAGHYKIPAGEYQMVKVWRDGDRLLSQVTGQPPIELQPSGPTEFFIDPRLADARITFLSEVGGGKATTFKLVQNGQEMLAPRLDEITAKQIADGLALKIQGMQPYPGSEAAARKLITDLVAGTPDYDSMTPGLGAVTKTQLPRLQTSLKLLGKLESLNMTGVAPIGADIYRAKFENGALDLRIIMDADGKVSGALLLPAN